MNLWWLIPVVAWASKELSIFHTNDIHSHYDQSNGDGMDCTLEQVEANQCYGGLARLKAAVDKLRAQHKNHLLLDAGDQFQGTLFYGYYRGNVTWEAMNLLRYDAMTVGNHEFDNGPDNLARVAYRFKFPLVCSNLIPARHPTLNKLIKNYVLFQEQRVALVGYITPKLPAIADIGPLLEVLDPVISVQRAIDRVRSLGYTRVIALSHGGYREDLALASKLHGLSMIIGGHSHSYLAPKDIINNPPPSQGLLLGRFLGHIRVKFGSEGYLTSITGSPLDLDSHVAKDPTVDALVHKWRLPFDAYGKSKVGIATEEFDRQTCYNRECTLGNFLADVMLSYRPKANVAILNSGDIRYKIDKGIITVADVKNALPYGSSVIDVNLTGQQIWDLVEGALSRTSLYNRRPVTSFIQVSNLIIRYRSNNPIYKKLQSIQTQVKSNLRPLNLTTTYSVVTTDFIAKGALDQAVIDYVKANSPISPVKSLNRIVNLDAK
ncbi:hypothetical protein L0F63_004940 [Massospora cicadina]|nr:hypothetical protein L0F63_004940 [Massospora cicadina]